MHSFQIHSSGNIVHNPHNVDSVDTVAVEHTVGDVVGSDLALPEAAEPAECSSMPSLFMLCCVKALPVSIYKYVMSKEFQTIEYDADKI